MEGAYSGNLFCILTCICKYHKAPRPATGRENAIVLHEVAGPSHCVAYKAF
jgi:hypothetical protein